MIGNFQLDRTDCSVIFTKKKVSNFLHFYFFLSIVLPKKAGDKGH